jgi:UDP-glucose 4-epimerase
MHEIMVSEEECNHTVRRGLYFAIQPMLPELAGDNGESPALSKALSSADDVLDFKGTLELLKRHSLLPGMTRLAQGEELLA